MNLIADGNGSIDLEAIATEVPVATQSSVVAVATPTTEVKVTSWVKTAIPWFLLVVVIVVIAKIVWNKMKGKK
jgi:hypothetical protein